MRPLSRPYAGSARDYADIRKRLVDAFEAVEAHEDAQREREIAALESTARSLGQIAEILKRLQANGR